ncbi:hypothetical protein NP493_574g00019 [Ridgeia piscesae]|nr:hypothetical protein NP493_574g00019 [Ridgeia piscesae]
MYLLIQ